MNDLSPKMRERLEKWLKDTTGAVSVAKPKKSQRVFVARGDYGDDIRDFEAKDAAAWQRELNNNPIYQGYR